MSCSLHREICECSAGADALASPRWQTDADLQSGAPAPTTAVSKTSEGGDGKRPSPVVLVNASPTDPVPVTREDSSAWRKEVTARLSRYQARRKPRAPRYPSLNLPFEGEVAAVVFAEASVPTSMLSDTAQALNEFVDDAAASADQTESSQAASPAQALQSMVEPGEQVPGTAPSHAPSARAQVTAKIIEFPRSWTPPAPRYDELAEAVATHPNILEVPEVVPAPPALGGITIEPTHQPEVEKRPGIDVPLQSAPVGRRVLSALVDDAIVAVACVLFGYIFWRLTSTRPPTLQAIGVLGGVTVLFWSFYQYLLIVYAGTTPGLRLAELELTRFNGSPAVRRIRRWRVLASFLSAVSLGMGYAWVFLDEDSLCWHDRITHTYLAPKRRMAATELPTH